jgi:stage II sporulation protein D
MLEERIYFDNLYIVASSGILRTINNVYIENYIAGVIESEAGSKQNLEYYKVQAIICRTYALSNLRRHQQEGFNLCDQVHCQVYKSKNRFNPEITKATNETKGFVVVDSDINLINASFHSNCGGQTVNAEDAWKYPLPYLRSVCDTFCSAQPHAYWSTVIPKKSWLGYLEKKHNFPVSDSTHLYYALNYSPIERNNYFSPISDSTLMLKTLRNDWQLRSTYFHITPHEDTIHITGSGFGHGVGLCQEGAMKMSECGYSYTEILHYYYTGVHVISLSALNFFREE